MHGRTMVSRPPSSCCITSWYLRSFSVDVMARESTSASNFIKGEVCNMSDIVSQKTYWRDIFIRGVDLLDEGRILDKGSADDSVVSEP